MASIKHLVDLDLSKNQLLNAVVQNLASAPASPSAGQIYWSTADDILYVYNAADTEWVALTENGVVNLSYTEGVSNGVITNDSGTNATIPLAGLLTAGLFSASEKSKLSGIQAGAQADQNASEVPSSASGNLTSTNVQSALQELQGDIDSLGSATNNLSISHLTEEVDIDIQNGAGITIDAATTSLAGVMSAADKTKLNSIETSADVTDATNVNAAGAVMNSDTSTAAMSFVIDEDAMGSNSSTKVPTQQSVKAYVDANLAASDAMIFKGTIGTGGTLTLSAFNSLAVYNAGWAYKVITAGTYKGVVSEVGDLFIATVDRSSGGVNADWTVVQANLDGAVIGPASAGSGNVVTFNGTSGKLIQDSGLTLSGSNTGDEPNASTTVKGIIEIATIAETNTGTDATRAVSPDGLDGWTGSGQITTVGTIGNGTWQGTAINQTYLVGQSGTNTGDEPTATTTVAGISELATNAEAIAGTATNRVITPANLRSVLGTTGTLSTTLTFNTTIGNGTLTSIPVTHGIGNQYVQTSVYEGTTKVECEVVLTSASVTTFKFNVAPTTNQYTVVITG